MCRTLLPARSLSLAPFLVLIATLSTVNAAWAIDSLTAELDWQFLEAETALAGLEPQLAESHYRAVVREAEYLLGLLALADGDRPAARQAFDRARNSTAIGLSTVRTALALTELQLGEIERPLRELRLVAHESNTDAARLERLVRSLHVTSQREEYDAELGRLRELDARAAEAVSAWAATEKASLPAVDLGPVAKLSAEARPALQARLEASLHRARRNIAILQTRTRFRVAESIDEVPTGSPFGKRDLGANAEDSPPIEPFRVSPVALMASAPASLRAAIVRLDRDDVEGALHELEILVREGGEEGAFARALIGEVLAERGEMDAAAAALQQAIDEAPSGDGARAAHQSLARLHLLAEEREQALRHLRQASTLGRLKRDLAWVLARAELDAGDLDAARVPLVDLDRRFDSVAALLHLSRISLRRGEIKRALDEAERAVRRAPNSQEVLRHHVRTALDGEVISSAARTVEPLVRMHPEVAEYRHLLGRTWMARGKMGEASEALLKAVELDPDLVPAMQPLGLALNHESRFEEGASYLRRYLEAFPTDPDALAALAEAEERLGDATTAENRARSVLAVQPDHPRANLVVGMITSGRGEFEVARSFLEKAVKADAWLAKAHYQLSFACARLGDRECAAHHLERYKKAQEGPETTILTRNDTDGPRLMQKGEGSNAGEQRMQGGQMMKKEGS